uniref:GATA-type domain-containing protein n=1 Tax=Erythrolobus australicus TaxID=1077150 RepID=A0A6T5W2Z0_9RHOD|mmetsp:Transcript_2158/g.5818  ORF Transcript_2158/g.5818 Transcript_2158/m.5818 type:complete len:183 (+) Transcript_2158:1437-1985(+)
MVAEKAVKRCSHCGTSDTPLWRLGPQGAKTLCNACGLRWRKTGRFVDDDAHAPQKQQHAVHPQSVSQQDAHQKVQHIPAKPAVAKKAKKPSAAGSAPAQSRPGAEVIAAARHANRSHRKKVGGSLSQAVDVERHVVNDYLPPAAEVFRQSATKRSERVYTLEDFWPYYHNVFSGLMVVHKSR